MRYRLSPPVLLALVALLGGTLSGPAPAHADAPLTIDRDEAVRLTLRLNPTILAAESQVRIAETHTTIAGALPNPSVNFSLNNQNPLDPSQQGAQVMITQTIPLTNAREYRKQMASEDVRQARFNLAQVKEAAVDATKKAYNGVLNARYDLDVAEDTLKWNQQLAKAAEAKLKLGELPAVESFRAKVALAQAQQDELSARNAVYTALKTLEGAIGYLQPLTIKPGAHIAIALIALPDERQLEATGLQHRPEIAAGLVGLHHEELNEALTRATILPSVDLTMGPGETAGVPGGFTGLTMQLPIWYANQGELQQSRYTQENLKFSQAALVNSIRVQIDQAASQTNLAAKQILLYQSNLLPNAKSLFEQARQRYLYGDASGYELEDARRAYRQALIAYGQTYLAYRNAVADLEMSLGTDLSLPKE